MKIAIVNDIHVGPALEHKGSLRAAYHSADDFVPHLLDTVQQHAPDLIINLGDLIRSEEKKKDLERYRQTLPHFHEMSCPVIHLVGNHELKRMSLKEVESSWEEAGFHQKSYGLKEIENVTLIWLGLEHTTHGYLLPFEQLEWLKEVLQNITRPTFIFTHCAIDDHNLYGNYFYELSETKNRVKFFLENQKNLQDLISEFDVVQGVVQAHLHYFHAKEVNGIPYITCPAMGDQICGPNTSAPQIYTVLNYDQHLTVKAFSREYCFAGAEFHH